MTGRYPATLLGSYLEDYMRPRGVHLADMEPADLEKPSAAQASRALGFSGQWMISRKLSGERPITERETVALADYIGANPVEALLLRIADKLECSPGSIEEMVEEVVFGSSASSRRARGAGS
jgi:hypothetical protein